MNVEDFKDDIRNGSPDAYRKLVGEWAQPMLRYAMSLGLDEDSGRDAVQDALVRIYKGRARIRSDGSLRTFCFHVLTHVVRDIQRAQARRTRHEAKAAAMQEHDTNGSGEEAVHLHATIAHEAWEMVRSLDGDLREVLALRFGQGLTFTETAEALALPLGTVKTMQRRGIEQLRDRFDRRPVAPVALSVVVLENALADTAHHPPVPLSPNWTATLVATLMATMVEKTSLVPVMVVVFLLAIGGGTWVIGHGSDDTENLAVKVPIDVRHYSGAHDNVSPSRNASENSGASKWPMALNPLPDTDTQPPAYVPETAVVDYAGSIPAHVPEDAEKPGPMITVTMSGNLIPLGGASVNNIDIAVFHGGIYRNHPVPIPLPSGADPDLAPPASGKGVSTPYVTTKVDAGPGFKVTFEADSRDFTDSKTWLYVVASRAGTPVGHGALQLTTSAECQQVNAASVGIPDLDEDRKQVYAETEGILIADPVEAVCKVMNAQGFPIEGARCAWISTFNSVIFEELYPVTWANVGSLSDGAGIARFTVPLGVSFPEDWHFLGAVAEGYGVGFSEGLSAQSLCMSRSVERTIILKSGADIVLKLVDAAGSPLANTEFRILNYLQNMVYGALDGKDGTLRTDTEGTCHLRHFPISTDGAINVGIQVTGYDIGYVKVVPSAIDFTCVLARPGSSVYAYRDKYTGEELSITRYCVIDAAGRQIESSVSDGGFDNTWTFATQGGKDERGSVRLWFAGYATPFTHEVGVRVGVVNRQVVEVDLSGGSTISGQIVDATGKAVWGASARLGIGPLSLRISDDFVNSADEAKPCYALAGTDGRFSIRAIPNGKFHLIASASGYLDQSFEFEATEYRPLPSDMIIRLAHGAELEVEFSGLDSKVIGDLGRVFKLVLILPGGAKHGGYVQSEKVLTFDELPIGPARAILEGGCFASQNFRDDPWAFDFESLEGRKSYHSFDIRCVCLSLRLLDAERQPLKQRVVNLTRVSAKMIEAELSDRATWPDVKRRSVMSSETGEALFPIIVPGTYIVMVEGGSPRIIRVDETREQAYELTIQPQ